MQSNAEALAVQEQMRRIAGGDNEERTSMRRELLHSQRGQLGRFLLRCLGELRIAVRKPEPGEVACAEQLRDGTAGARETSQRWPRPLRAPSTAPRRSANAPSPS